ncbi:unnamed protein product [Ectocarpus sp. 12 AP-2014]
MAEVAIENRVYRYEAKPQPTANEPGKIVEAFGLGKCPKLAEQVRSDSLLVRVNTLRVLCEEFKNPTIIAGSVKAGLMSTLPKMALDSDLNTRKFSSKAMVAAARDYNGRTALLKARTATLTEASATIGARAPETMFKALDDSSVDVRRNIYEALANASTTGTRALVDAGYPARLVDKAVNETEELQPLALRGRPGGGARGVSCGEPDRLVDGREAGGGAEGSVGDSGDSLLRRHGEDHRHSEQRGFYAGRVGCYGGDRRQVGGHGRVDDDHHSGCGKARYFVHLCSRRVGEGARGARRRVAAQRPQAHREHCRPPRHPSRAERGHGLPTGHPEATGKRGPHDRKARLHRPRGRVVGTLMIPTTDHTYKSRKRLSTMMMM